MRSGDARAQFTNSLIAWLREGGGFGMQNGFGPRKAAMFCICTKTAPWTNPSQKWRAAVPIELSGVAVQSSTRSAVVLASKLASVAACNVQGASTANVVATAHLLTVMIVFPSIEKIALRLKLI